MKGPENMKNTNNIVKQIAFGMAMIMIMSCSTGCVDVSTMTQSQNDEVSEYMAGELLKYNKDNTMVINYDRETNTVIQTPSADAVSAEPTTTESTTETTAEPEESTGTQPAQTSDTTSDSTLPSAEDVSDVYGIDGLEFDYVSYSLKDSYKSSNVEVSSGKSNTLLVAKFEIKNKSSKTIKINMLDKNIYYGLSINGGSSVSLLFTVLPDDIQIIEKSIKSGQTVKGVLVFEIADSTSVESAKLNVSNGNTQGDISIK